MGNNCSSIETPITTNLCAVSVGDRPDQPMPGFCTLLGVGGDSYRSQYCGLMSSAGEWGNPETSGSCTYDDCQPFRFQSSGCCNGCCGIIGGGLSCQRESFTGTPVTCCFNDLDCSGLSPIGNPPQCYSDANQQQTCADGIGGQPNYRSLVSTDCQNVLLQYCTGTLPTDDPTSTAWLSRWTQSGTAGNCTYALTRNLFRNGPSSPPGCFPPPVPIQGVCNLPPPIPFDSEGYFWAQQLMAAAFIRYQEQGFTVGTTPGFVGFNPWQDFIYANVCCPYPGVCQSGLETVCATKTAQRISLNPTTAQWCGCHLPAGEYEAYSVKFNVPPECTPMCNRAGTIPIVGINAEPVMCKQDTCIIDGVTVNLINSQIGGGINFDQVCANCGGANCSCIISNTTIDIENSTIGGNVIPVSAGCGSFTCSQTNPGTTGPVTLAVSCTGGAINPYTEFEAEQAAAQAQQKKNAWLWTLVAIGIALALIYLIIYFVHPVMGHIIPVSSSTPAVSSYAPTTSSQSTGFTTVDSGFVSIE